MSDIEIVASTPAHVEMLGSCMREEDANEAIHLGLNPQHLLWMSYKNSVMRKTVFVDGYIAGMWGVSGQVGEDVGHPWLITSSAVYRRNPLAFALLYRQEIREMLKIFPVLRNRVDAKYLKSVRMLELVGFKVYDAEPLGETGALFRLFEMAV